MRLKVDTCVPNVFFCRQNVETYFMYTLLYVKNLQITKEQIKWLFWHVFWNFPTYTHLRRLSTFVDKNLDHLYQRYNDVILKIYLDML